MDVGESFVAGDGSSVGVEPADGAFDDPTSGVGLHFVVVVDRFLDAVLPMGREQFEAVVEE